LQAHVFAPRRHGFTEFLKGLHFDICIKKSQYTA